MDSPSGLVVRGVFGASSLEAISYPSELGVVLNEGPKPQGHLLGDIVGKHGRRPSWWLVVGEDVLQI